MSSMWAWLGWRTCKGRRRRTLHHLSWKSPCHRFSRTSHRPPVSGQPPPALRLQKQSSRWQCHGSPAHRRCCCCWWGWSTFGASIWHSLQIQRAAQSGGGDWLSTSIPPSSSTQPNIIAITAMIISRVTYRVLWKEVSWALGTADCGNVSLVLCLVLAPGDSHMTIIMMRRRHLVFVLFVCLLHKFPCFCNTLERFFIQPDNYGDKENED